MVKVLNWVAVSAVLAASAFAAEAKVLDCAIAVNASHDGWVMDREIFDFDAEAGTATVLDAMTQTYMGGAIPAQVVDRTMKKVAFSWKVQSTSNTGKPVNMVYRAAYYSDTNTMVVTAAAPGFSNKYEARGTCTVK